MRAHALLTLLLGAVAMTGGCAATRTYDVTVTNNLTGPVTLWLTKNGPPDEPKWLSPEQLAEGTVTEQISGATLAAGKTADTGKLTGHFDPGTDAILRVYRGQNRLSDLLAMSRGSANRVDITLAPGRSKLVVHERSGALVIDPAETPGNTAH